MPSPHFLLPVKRQRGSEQAGILLALLSKSLHEPLTVAHDIMRPSPLPAPGHRFSVIIQ